MQQRLIELHRQQRALIEKAKNEPIFNKAKYIEAATDLQAEINELHTKAIFGGDDVSS